MLVVFPQRIKVDDEKIAKIKSKADREMQSFIQTVSELSAVCNELNFTAAVLIRRSMNFDKRRSLCKNSLPYL